MADEKPPTQWIHPQGIASTAKVGFHVPEPPKEEPEKDDKESE